MIYDLHNDIVLKLSAKKTREFIGNNAVALAVWGTELDETRAAAYARAAAALGRPAFEDVSCFSKIEDALAFEPLYVSMTWNFENRFGGGALSDAGLKDEGRRALKIIGDRGIVFDTAHLNRKTFFKAAERVGKVICSHTCFNEVCRHPRNLTPAQIELIIDKGGIVGLALVGDFLGGRDKTAVIRHIEWFAQRYGTDNLALGTDFFGTKPLNGLASYDQLDSLKEDLSKRGFTPRDIENIFYANAANFFRGEL